MSLERKKKKKTLLLVAKSPEEACAECASSNLNDNFHNLIAFHRLIYCSIRMLTLNRNTDRMKKRLINFFQ